MEADRTLSDDSVLYLYAFVALPVQLPAIAGVEENTPVFLVEYADTGCVVSVVPDGSPFTTAVGMAKPLPSSTVTVCTLQQLISSLTTLPKMSILR